MDIGHHLLSWREQKGFSQQQLSQQAGLSRVYLCRLEQGKADPSLSVLRHLASSLEITLGELCDQEPPPTQLTRESLDEWVRGALAPSAQSHPKNPLIRSLARALQGKRAAMGIYTPRKKMNPAQGKNYLRRIRARLGEKQWQALIKRIEKHAPFFIPPST